MDTDCNTDCTPIGETQYGVKHVVAQQTGGDDCNQTLVQADGDDFDALAISTSVTETELYDGSSADEIQLAIAERPSIFRPLIHVGDKGVIKAYKPGQVLGTYRIVSVNGKAMLAPVTLPNLLPDSLDEEEAPTHFMGMNRTSRVCDGTGPIPYEVVKIPSGIPEVLPTITAVDDTAETDFETAVNIDVLANDTVTSPVVTITTPPTNGDAVVELDGTVTYTPDAAFDGVDTFVYTITDPFSQTDTATVSVTVNAEVIDPGEEPTCYSGFVEYRYDASLLTGSDLDAVSAWPDTSGNARDASQATSGNRPILRTAIRNGLNAVEFGGVDDFMTTASFATSVPNNGTIFAVFKPDTAGGTVFSHQANGGASAGEEIIIATSATVIACQLGATRSPVSYSDGTGWLLVKITTDFTSGINRPLEVTVNGVVVDTDVNYSLGSIGNVIMRLGARNHGFGNETFFDGLVGEIIMISSYDETCAINWETHLKDKWGFTY
jgi:hypothetical protein